MGDGAAKNRLANQPATHVASAEVKAIHKNEIG